MKSVVVEAEKIQFLYELSNPGEKALDLIFASEWNFYLLDQEWKIDRNAVSLLKGRWRIEFSPSPRIWHFPLQTLSQSEEGYDIIHQGVCFLPQWQLRLDGGEKVSLKIQWKEGP